MPKVDPFSLERPGAVEEERSFSDPLQPGVIWDLAFRATADRGTWFRAEQKKWELVETYVTGNTLYQNNPDHEDAKPPAQVAIPKQEPVVITVPLCEVVAKLTTLETAYHEQHGGGDTPFTERQWFALSANAPNAFQDITAWAGTLILKAEGHLKNAPMGSTDTTSGLPSEKAQETIPS